MAGRPRKRHKEVSWADTYRTSFVARYSSEGSVTHSLVRALIRGLLVYYSKPGRRRVAESYGLDWQEDGLLDLIKQLSPKRRKAHKTSYGNDQVNQNANCITKKLESLLHHPHPLALAPESDWIIEQLAPYKDNSSIRRLDWLKTELPSLLRGLNARSRCGYLYCPRHTKPLDIATLEAWVYPKDTIGNIRLHILAYFHGSTFETVRRALSSRFP